MSDELSHVLIGKWIGKAVDAIPNEKVSTPLVAFLLGFAAHGVMDKLDNDYTMNYQAWTKDVEQLKKDAPVLALQVSGIGKAIWDLFQVEDDDERATQLAGILGSIAPDVIDGVYAFINPTAWQKGELLMPFHRYAGVKPMQSQQQAVNRGVAMNLIQWSWRF